MLKRLLLAAVLGFALAPPAAAFEVDQKLDDPALEARAQELFKDLRCLVCQNQSIADSNADLARDLRVIVRERIVAGDNDQQVLDYMVARYGDWVLLEPPFKVRTLFLWVGPGILFVLAAAGLVAYYRRGRRAPPPAVAPLNADEEKRLGSLLDDGRG